MADERPAIALMAAPAAQLSTRYTGSPVVLSTIALTPTCVISHPRSNPTAARGCARANARYRCKSWRCTNGTAAAIARKKPCKGSRRNAPTETMIRATSTLDPSTRLKAWLRSVLTF